MRALTAIFCLLAALPAASVTAKEARIRLPAGLADRVERVDLTGIGGQRSGSLALGTSTGTFTRQADRLGIADPLYARNYGGSAVEISGAEIGGRLRTTCRFDRVTASLGPVSINARRLAYRCAFERDGQTVVGALELADRAGMLGSVDGREAREGFVRFDGVEMRLRSIHRPQGSLFTVPHALGYVFEQAGQAIGAVDLNGDIKRLYLPADPQKRQAVLAASLALALFWDPALVDPVS